MTRAESVPHEPKGYLVQLTAVRGVACLVVVLGHVVQVFRYQVAQSSPLAHIWRFIVSAFNAEAAVLVFFVLSGCVLALSLRSMTTLSAGDVLRFYVRRLFRIYPLLWCAVGLSVASVVVLHQTIPPGATVDWLTRNLATPVDAKHVALALTGGFTRYNGPMWSLRVEILFSVVFPVLLLGIRSPLSRSALLLLCVLCDFVPLPDGAGPQFALAFALGAMIPMLGRARVRSSMVPAVALLVLAYDRVSLGGHALPEQAYDLIETLAAFVLIRDIYYENRWQTVLTHISVVWLGELSYSVYLLHLPLLLGVFAIGQMIWGAPALLAAPVFTQCGLAGATIALTIPLAWATYRWIELPFHNLGRRLARHMRGSLSTRNPQTVRLETRS